ncbi:MAG: glycosyltransferase family 39 protein [Patescibacteria group bacterium]|jgi:4-amino-4-deoxy-L-arabinose transferase-like glycosyltransferase
MLKDIYLTFLKKNLKEILLVLLLLVVGFLPRFLDLGYSHFYGDETKTLYVDKTVPASQFLLNQRKGPVQFMVVWVMEKLTGGFDEGAIRLPFAIFGLASVVLLFLVVRKLYGIKAGFISAMLFSLNGFLIAFSRTAQYQSPLIFFGLLSILLALYIKKERFYLSLILSSVSIALSFLCHYDAIFFLVPLLLLLWQKYKELHLKLIHTLYFVMPFCLVLSVFYLPYVYGGYMVNNTVNYVQRRLTGDTYAKNYSLYTIFIYNPFLIGNLMLFLSSLSFFKQDKKIFAVWFMTAFVVFQLVFLNPGTHIIHYLIPVIILVGAEISVLRGLIGKAITLLLILVLAIQFIYSMKTFVPRFGDGYPWSSNVNTDYHLYLYGFPYNRGWDQVRDYLYSKEGVRSFYTNDNAVMASYYLQRFDLTPMGANYLPQYYVYVRHPQEFFEPEPGFLLNYQLERDFIVNGEVTTSLYKLK